MAMREEEKRRSTIHTSSPEIELNFEIMLQKIRLRYSRLLAQV